MNLFEKNSQIAPNMTSSSGKRPAMIFVIVGLLAVLASMPVLTSTVHGAGFDFTLSSSNNITIVQGSEGSTTITVTLTSGSSSQVILSCNNLPSGATCSPNPQTGFPNPTFTSVLTVSAAFSTPVGGSTFNVVGTGGGLTHTIPVTLDVRPAGSVGGISLPTTSGGSLLPITAIGITIIAIIGAAVYSIRNRPKTGRSTPKLDTI